MNRRLPLVLVMIAALVLSGVTRRWSAKTRATGVLGAVSSGGAGLSQMNSYALALVLGGLRGPLVWALWSSAETQKSERNLEDFDTKIEWIRLLQAEFDSVHVYQIWNKAYNISAQMANMGNKYTTILDAMEYAHNVDAERPNDINLVVAIAQLYAEKLGTSSEQDWYRQRVRDDSLPRQAMVRVTIPAAMRDQLTKQTSGIDWPPSKLKFSTDESDDTVSLTLPKAIWDKIQSDLSGPGVKFVDRPVVVSNKNDPQWKRRELDQMLDSNNRILPQYDSELQYLRPFEPYPYGISPMALGYNYNKRAQVLMKVNHQKHASLSNMTISKTPAVNLKFWSEEEWERGRRAEAETLGVQAPADRRELELTTADLPPTTSVRFQSRFEEALFSYDRALMIIKASLKEYEEHLKEFKGGIEVYTQHMDDLVAEQLLVTADRDYLAAMVASPSERAALTARAAENYRKVIPNDQVLFFRNFLPPEVAPQVAPPGMDRTNVGQADPALLEQMFAKVKAMAAADAPQIQSNKDQVDEYDRYITRAKTRLKHLPQ